MYWLFGKSKKEHTDFTLLKEKWGIKQANLHERLWEKHGKALDWFVNTPRHLAVTSLVSMMLFVSAGSPLGHTSSASAQEKQFRDLDTHVFFQSDLSHVLPQQVQELTPQQETAIGALLSRNFHMKVSAELQGIRLNRSYGYIGAEQHLARFNGDTMDSHFDTTRDADQYYNSGMAPGLGAWGYFASSEDQMTKQDVLREKYYIAVQTFLAPGYADNVAKYSNFFKYRKMLVVNPNNAKAIVVVIGDSGPSEWTGKQLGGSPEVMHYLERVDGSQKGAVLYYFIDDPTNTVPLGPISL